MKTKEIEKVTDKGTQKQTISVSLVKKVVATLESRVKPGEYELRAEPKEIVKSVVVLTFKKIKKWDNVNRKTKKGMKVEEDVILRKVMVFNKEFQTAELNNGVIEDITLGRKFKNWEEFILVRLDDYAVRHEVIPLVISRKGIVSGKPQLEK